MTRQATTRVNKTAVLLVACLSSTLTPIIGSTVNIALPAIDKDLGLTAVEVTWINTIFILVSAMMLVPFGRLADIYGRKKSLPWAYSHSLWHPFYVPLLNQELGLSFSGGCRELEPD